MLDIATLLQQGATNAWLFIPSAILLGALHGLELCQNNDGRFYRGHPRHYGASRALGDCRYAFAHRGCLGGGNGRNLFSQPMQLPQTIKTHMSSRTKTIFASVLLSAKSPTGKFYCLV
jgi:hypothetical protein